MRKIQLSGMSALWLPINMMRSHLQSSIFNLFLLIFLLHLPLSVSGQKKELSQARTYLKSGKDFDKAEKLMTDLLRNDSASRTNERVYLLWFEAVHRQYAQANERFYLKQSQDTATFFELTHRMFTILEHLDSLDMRPDSRGRVALEYRQKHAQLLHAYRPNLFAGGMFLVRRGKWQQAYSYFESYLDCAIQPLFTGYDYEHTDARMAQAAYWATYCGYRQHDAVLTLRHRHKALADTAKVNFTLQYVAEARLWLDDEELYLETLREGFRHDAQFPYFFPRLMDYYTHHGQFTEALAVADSALAVNDSSELFLFAKSTILLRMERYEESVDISRQLIGLNDTLPEPYFNAGTACLNMALGLNPHKDKKQLRAYYQQARSYMEHYRELMPREQQKWGPALYRIYLNLNMGRQFDEIDRLLRGEPVSTHKNHQTAKKQ